MPTTHAITIIKLRTTHTRASALTLLLTALLATATGTAVAQSQTEENFGDKNQPWQEAEIELPPAPKPENLLSFYVSATATQSFAIDAPSLSVGTDGVIRYTLVATSAAGARSVSFEGVRCATYERKLYAFGRPDGTWSRSRRNQWELIGGNAANRHHATLAQDYFCAGTTVAGNAKDMIARLRQQNR